MGRSGASLAAPVISLQDGNVRPPCPARRGTGGTTGLSAAQKSIARFHPARYAGRNSPPAHERLLLICVCADSSTEAGSFSENADGFAGKERGFAERDDGSGGSADRFSKRDDRSASPADSFAEKADADDETAGSFAKSDDSPAAKGDADDEKAGSFAKSDDSFAAKADADAEKADSFAESDDSSAAKLRSFMAKWTALLREGAASGQSCAGWRGRGPLCRGAAQLH